MKSLASLFAFASLVVACGGTDGSPIRAAGGGTTIIGAAGGADGGAAIVDASTSPTDAAGPGTDGSIADAAAPSDSASAADAGDLAQRLGALTATCTVASNGKYATDQGSPPTVDVCKLKGAFFWTADMDIDCDGQSTTQCNGTTDPAYQNQTSFTQSDGQPLVASTLPYVVVPLPSTRFDYAKSGIQPGALVIVLYQGKLSYGVFGDEGPNNIIGESSYAMAKSLGVNPDPANGGTDGPVTYIVLTGTGAVVSPIEDHAAAVTLGGSLAAQLLANN